MENERLEILLGTGYNNASKFTKHSISLWSIAKGLSEEQIEEWAILCKIIKEWSRK